MHSPLAPPASTELHDVSRAALDFVHRLLLRPASDQPDLPGLLAELTAAFQAESARLALTQQIPASTPLHTYPHEVYRAAQAGAQFTHQLRLFSRRQSSSSRPSQLSAVLAEQEARLFAAQPTGLNFRLNVPADLPPVG